jgi:ribulose-phosphate 3-epimerase
MDRKIKLSASIMCANLLNLEQDLSFLREADFDYLHLDFMDGHFVPEVGLGTFFLEQLIQKQSIPVDVHLMVDHPHWYIGAIADAGASIVIFHVEVGDDVYSILQTVKHHAIDVGVALRPYTPIELIKPCLDDIDLVLLMTYAPGIRNQEPMPTFANRIDKLNNLLVTNNRTEVDIAVDGGISEANIAEYNRYGANFFVLGSSGLFVQHTDLTTQIGKIKNILQI